MGRLYVIAYDVSDDRRRRRLAGVLEGFGERVQESVFECWLDGARLRRLLERLESLIDPECDRLRCYPMCGRDLRGVRWDGHGQRPMDAVMWSVLEGGVCVTRRLG